MSSVRFNKKISGIIQKTVTVAIAGAICFCIASIPAPKAQALSTSQMKDKISQYEQREQEIKNKLSKLEDDKAEADDIASALKEKIDNLEKQISLVNDTIDALNEKMDEAEKKISAKQKEIDEAKDTLKERLRAIYIAGSNSELQVLLSADSYADYLAKAELMRGVTKHDTELMQKLNNDIKEINKLKKEIESDKKDAAEMKASLVDKQNELDADYQKAQANSSSISSQQSDLESESEEIAAAKAKMREELKAAAMANSNNNNQMNGGNSNSGNGGSGGNSSGAVSSFGFVWPFQSSYYISCGYHGYSGHTGIDITCSGALGKPIYAAASGTVVRATWSNRSYGNCLVIDHGLKDGDRINTLYAHCQTLLVSEGDHVEQGQLIARCGSTGNSTGPHLHFEVWVNGNDINPLSCF